MKQVQYEAEARASLKAGVDILANAVKVTLGPKGRNVIINNGIGYPYITKDGVTVAKSVEVEDVIQNTGVMMIKSVALKTAQVAGDGTTTATVLAQAIIEGGIAHINKGVNPMDLKRGIDKAVAVIVVSLKEQSTVVGDDKDQLEHVALISTNNDKELAAMISSTMHHIGKNGIINVEDSSNPETKVLLTKGMSFDRGYIHPAFINNQAKQRCEFDDAFILLHDKKISRVEEIQTLLEYVVQQQLPIVIVTEDIEGPALSLLAVNKEQNNLRVCVVKSPEMGDLRYHVMDDIAASIGGISVRDANKKSSFIDPTAMGFCKKIIIEENKTTIIGGQGSPDEISARKKIIEEAIENCHDDYDKEILKTRLAKMDNRVATMFVGGTTEVEINEKKDRIDDAIHATRAAQEEGIVPGGGVAYIRAIQSLAGIGYDTDDEFKGILLIQEALESPLKQICINAGVDPVSTIDTVKKSNVKNFGYNARTEEFTDLIENGVIDPTKVSRVALENAASIASLLLTTECLLINTK